MAADGRSASLHWMSGVPLLPRDQAEPIQILARNPTSEEVIPHCHITFALREGGNLSCMPMTWHSKELLSVMVSHLKSLEK